MEQYEEDIYRLNLTIKKLISRNDFLETQNDKLEIENRVLAAENSQLNDANISVSQSNMLNKMQLEKEISQREQLYEANQRHKERYKMLMDRYTEQSDKMKTMEHSLRAAASTKRINHVPVEIIALNSRFSTILGDSQGWYRGPRVPWMRHVAGRLLGRPGEVGIRRLGLRVAGITCHSSQERLSWPYFDGRPMDHLGGPSADSSEIVYH
ncbi:hypothetical protein RP20_CCG018781 [Aedes albopictus]|nr:hypothetical protein RP20_CCG018781 [Aedes albopictus]